MGAIRGNQNMDQVYSHTDAGFPGSSACSLSTSTACSIYDSAFARSVGRFFDKRMKHMARIHRENLLIGIASCCIADARMHSSAV
jgi:hypothetical protein